MECIIDGKTFQYISNAIQNDEKRSSYFKLAKKIFSLDFNPWHQSGFCGDCFIPYTLYDEDIAVASVGIVISKFKWQSKIKNYVQISTVMTDAEYQGMGLCRWLMELVLKEWKDKSDLIYLYANDSVLDFYPKFGFEKVTEYSYSMPISKQIGKYRKLDLKIPDDAALLTEKYKYSNNPFSSLVLENNLSMIMFHCITFLHDNIYYIEQYDAVVIAEYQNDVIFCYDIFTDANCSMNDVISVLATEDTTSVSFGFTPKSTYNCIIGELKESDTTVFTLKSKENIFMEHKVTFPFLSRA